MQAAGPERTTPDRTPVTLWTPAERTELLNSLASTLRQSIEPPLPLSVRYGAAEAAVAYVEAWYARTSPRVRDAVLVGGTTPRARRAVASRRAADPGAVD